MDDPDPEEEEGESLDEALESLLATDHLLRLSWFSFLPLEGVATVEEEPVSPPDVVPPVDLRLVVLPVSSLSDLSALSTADNAK